MKKLNLILFVAALTFFTSCDSDDSESKNVPEVSERLIIGVWNLTALETTNGRSEATIQDQTITTEFTAVGKDFDVVLTFNEDPKTAVSEGSYTTVLTTSAFGETLTQEGEGEDFFQNSEWRLDGNTLYFGSDDDEVGFTITNFTETQMDLLLELDQQIAVDESEFIEFSTSVTATYTITLTR